MTRTLFVVQKPTGSRKEVFDEKEEGTVTAMVQRVLPDLWWDCAMEGYCYFRNVHDKTADGKRAYEKRCDVNFYGLLIPFGATVSCKPIFFSKDDARLHQFDTKMFRRRMVSRHAHHGMRNLENLSDPDIRVKRCKHQEVALERKLLFPCADGDPSTFSIFLKLPRGAMPARRNPEQN